MSRKNVIQALQNAGLGQFNEARVNRFNLHRELENFFKHKSSMPLAISQQKLHSLMNPAQEAPKPDESAPKAQRVVQKNVHRK